MKAREYELLHMAVEDGVDVGYKSAHRHTDTPTKAMLKDCVRREVMGQICEWFDFEDHPREPW